MYDMQIFYLHIFLLTSLTRLPQTYRTSDLKLVTSSRTAHRTGGRPHRGKEHPNSQKPPRFPPSHPTPA